MNKVFIAWRDYLYYQKVKRKKKLIYDNRNGEGNFIDFPCAIKHVKKNRRKINYAHRRSAAMCKLYRARCQFSYTYNSRTIFSSSTQPYLDRIACTNRYFFLLVVIMSYDRNFNEPRVCSKFHDE